jgi:hypothetical protein
MFLVSSLLQFHATRSVLKLMQMHGSLLSSLLLLHLSCWLLRNNFMICREGERWRHLHPMKAKIEVCTYIHWLSPPNKAIKGSWRHRVPLLFWGYFQGKIGGIDRVLVNGVVQHRKTVPSLRKCSTPICEFPNRLRLTYPQGAPPHIFMKSLLVLMTAILSALPLLQTAPHSEKVLYSEKCKCRLHPITFVSHPTSL